MDYKKKYEEALLTMRQKVESGVIDESYAEAIFPELKVVNDKMIVDALISYFESELNDYGNVEWRNRIRPKSIIAWLEKQEEHQEYPKDVIDNAISFLANRNEGMPEEEAKDIVNAIITVLNPSYWPKQGEQKPTEWSEEDREMRIKVLKYLSTRCNVPEYEEVECWLKSLKDRVLPQPNQEWSEEDERNSYNLLYFLNSNRITADDREDSIQWLKSLRPNHWKPSGEQMEALKFCIEHNIDNEGILGSKVVKLFNELKKL